MSQLRWFRQAQPRSAGHNLLKTAAQTAVFWTVFLVLLPYAIVSLESACGVQGFASTTLTRLGWLALALASALGLWSGFTMSRQGEGTPLPIDCPRRLVTGGPYAYVRNPMAIAGLSQGAAVGLVLGSWGVFAYVAVGAVLWNSWVRPIEEAHLAEIFGSTYAEYRHAVRCWVPRRLPYRGSQRT